MKEEGGGGGGCQSPIHHGLCLAHAAIVALQRPSETILFAGKKKIDGRLTK